jgi:serine/threonine protein kinase
MASEDESRVAFLSEVLSAHEYDLMERIGVGSYGSVYAISSRKYKHVVFAAKIMTLQSPGANISLFETEIEILTRLSHSNIVSLYDAFHSGNVCFIILEYCPNGTIDTYIRSQKMSEALIIGVFRQITSAVAYCHSEGIALRDVKPANILIDHYGRPKLVDFGLSCIVKPHDRACCTGSLSYMAPELFANPKNINLFSADIWSLGITFYRLLVGSAPWPRSANPAQLINAIVQSRPELPDTFDPALRALIAQMTARDPSARPNADELLNNPLFPQRQTVVIGRPVTVLNRCKSEAKISPSHSTSPLGTVRPLLLFPTKGSGDMTAKPTSGRRDQLRRFSQIATPQPKRLNV